MQGRPSGEVADFSFARKGIYGNVTLGVEVLTSWTMFSLPLDDYSTVLRSLPFTNVSGPTPQVPSFFRGTLSISGPRTQTFLLTPDWGRGIVIVNGFNLGRFTNLGPQCSCALVYHGRMLAV